MQNEILSIYHLSVAPKDFDAFEELVQRIVTATSKEADTTIYEYVVNADHTVVAHHRTLSNCGLASARRADLHAICQTISGIGEDRRAVRLWRHYA